MELYDQQVLMYPKFGTFVVLGPGFSSEDTVGGHGYYDECSKELRQKLT